MSKAADETVHEIRQVLVSNGWILDDKTILELAILVVEHEKSALENIKIETLPRNRYSVSEDKL